MYMQRYLHKSSSTRILTAETPRHREDILPQIDADERRYEIKSNVPFSICVHLRSSAAIPLSSPRLGVSAVKIRVD
jgi:hypothetical protein